MLTLVGSSALSPPTTAAVGVPAARFDISAVHGHRGYALAAQNGTGELDKSRPRGLARNTQAQPNLVDVTIRAQQRSQVPAVYAQHDNFLFRQLSSGQFLAERCPGDVLHDAVVHSLLSIEVVDDGLCGLGFPFWEQVTLTCIPAHQPNSTSSTNLVVLGTALAVLLAPTEQSPPSGMQGRSS